jgi:hypothetical protein
MRMIESSGLKPTTKGIAESRSCGEVSVVMGEAWKARLVHKVIV